MNNRRADYEELRLLVQELRLKTLNVLIGFCLVLKVR